MRSRPGSNTIKPSLEVIPFPASPPVAAGTQCPNCTDVMTILQPDSELPDRQIGVCEHCKHWYLIDILAGVSGGTMLRLPDVQVIRNLSRENPSSGISLMNGGEGDDSAGRTGSGDIPEEAAT
jgi:hypothetical protein